MWLFSSNKLNNILSGDNDQSKDLEINPFVVLKMFLDELSRFDWKKFGISVTGLVLLNGVDSVEIDSVKDEIAPGDYDLSLTAIVNEYRERLQPYDEFDGKIDKKEHEQEEMEGQTTLPPSPPILNPYPLHPLTHMEGLNESIPILPHPSSHESMIIMGEEIFSNPDHEVIQISIHKYIHIFIYKQILI
jgi:hypothetical protein